MFSKFKCLVTHLHSALHLAESLPAFVEWDSTGLDGYLLKEIKIAMIWFSVFKLDVWNLKSEVWNLTEAP